MRRLTILLLMLAGLIPGLTWASSITLDEVRAEWARLFPTPVIRSNAPLPSLESYAILHKEFLFIRPDEISPAILFRSWQTIRDYPVPLRRAHASCVKIITPNWHGAGIVISPDGYILTCYHLVAGVPGACVMTLEGQVFTLTNMVAYSAVYDLALLKIPAETPVYIPLEEGVMAPVGSPLSIVGHPGDITWKLSQGTVVRHYNEGRTSLLHFDSDIGHGNSGGPVIDQQGRLCAITACIAQLADGSKVKAGVDIQTIREFLSSSNNPVSFTQLYERDKNWRMTEFLGTITVVLDLWIREWQAAMASVSISEERSLVLSSTKRLRLGHIREVTETSVKLLLLRSLLNQCELTAGLDPRLYRSMKETANAMDQLIDGTASLREVSTADQLQSTMKILATRRTDALSSFGQALASLEESGRSLETAPPRQEAIRTLCNAYPQTGNHVGSTLRTGQGIP